MWHLKFVLGTHLSAKNPNMNPPISFPKAIDPWTCDFLPLLLHTRFHCQDKNT